MKTTMAMYSSSLQFLVALAYLSFLGMAKVELLESQVECTVFTILGTTTSTKGLNGAFSFFGENSDYVCTADNPITTYKIYGDVKSYIGPSYQSSITTLIFSSSIVDDDKVIDLNDDFVRASVSVPSNKFLSGDQTQPRSQNNEGTFKALAIRVVDKTGDEPVESANEIYGAFFEDSINFGVSVKSVLSGCSGGKLQIIPATGSAVTSGVVEVTVNYKVAGKHYINVSDDVLKSLPSGIDNYKYTLMVFPKSVDLGSEYIVGKGNYPGTKTWYKSTYVQNVNLGVHEIGHNLYQDHSGADDNFNGIFDYDEEAYDDSSCTMGGEWGNYSEGQKCFNAAKTYYLGWFLDYHGDVIPRDDAFSGTLVGVNDAGNGEILPDQYVTVRISDSRAIDLYLMYNRVEGVNKFFKDSYYRDKVVIVEQNGAGRQSWVKSVLDQGETYTQSNWARTGKSLKIKVCSMSSGTPDTAVVGIWLDGINKITDCDAPPTVSPAPTTRFKEIQWVGDPCTSVFPLTGKCTECTGDCDLDSDCEDGLVCYQRNSGDVYIPGCVWGSNSPSLINDGGDYCIKPTMPTPTPTVSTLAPTISTPTPTVSTLAPTISTPTPTVSTLAPSASTQDELGTPSLTPFVSPPTEWECSDSTLRLRTFNGKGEPSWRGCVWVSNKPYRCNDQSLASHCPETCNICNTCQDSTLRFKLLKAGGRRIARNCEWVKNKQTLIRCAYAGVAETCPRTCGLCN